MMRLLALAAAIATCLLLPTSAVAGPEAARTAFWRLNETSGTHAEDSKGSNDGTYAGGYTLGQPGATGDGDRAVRLDGSSGQVTTSYNPFQNGTARSFEGWAYRDDTSSWHTLFAGSSATRQPQLYMPINNTDIVWYSDAGVATQVRWSAAAPTGQWFHWAFVFDEAGDRAELFVNGTSLGSKAATVPYNSAPGDLILGGRGDGGNDFKGRLDDVAVYSRGLSSGEVAQLALPPDTSITSGPSGETDTDPTFTFISSESSSIFECKLDGPGGAQGTFTSCTSPKTYSNLATGSYTFNVRAKDVAGNVDATPATRTFTVGTCNQTASPGGAISTPDGLIAALSPGQTGCFRDGTYGDKATEITVNKANITLRSYPGETARLNGRMVINGAGDGVAIRELRLDGLNPANLPSPTINGEDVIIADNEITHRDPANPIDGGICVQPATWNGSSGHRFVIERNRIHDCGEEPWTNHHHGIYVTDVTGGIIRNNVIYDNSDRGVQLYPSAQSTQVYNNTIDGNDTGIIVSVSSANNTIRDNIVSNAARRFNVEEDSLTGTGNVLRDNCVWASTGDPWFDQGGSGIHPDLGPPEWTLSNNAVQNPNYVNRSGKDFRDQNANCNGKGAPDDVAAP